MWPNVIVTDPAGKRVEAQVLPSRHRNNALPPSLPEKEFGKDGVSLDGVAGGGGGGVVGSQGSEDQHPYTLVLALEAFMPLEAKVFHVTRNATEKVDGADSDGGSEIDARRELEDGERRDKERRVLEQLPGQSPRDEIEHFEENEVEGEMAVVQDRPGAGSTSRRESEKQQQRNGGNSESPGGYFSISSDLITLTFNGTTGRLARMETLGGGVGTEGETGAKSALDLDQGWFYYPTFDGKNAGGVKDNGSGNPAAGGQQEQQVLSGRSALAEASRLHGELSERLETSQDQQKGGAYIFRPEGGRGRDGATPVGADEGGEEEEEAEERGGEGGGDGLRVKEWWVEEGPVVSEVHQVRVSLLERSTLLFDLIVRILYRSLFLGRGSEKFQAGS